MVYGLAVQTDGKLLVAGELSNSNTTTSDAFVTRFSADGQVDTSFGALGTARAIALQDDGKILSHR
jgi:Domain of unknown function (DUF5122) beta-propeller